MAFSNSNFTKDESMATVAPNAPVTQKRPQEPDLDSYIPKPYLARALMTVSKEHPKGGETIYPNHKHNNMSLLQQHISFFDRNKDGVVYPWETFAGLRAMGANFFIAIFVVIITHISFSYATSTCWIPSLLLPIYIARVHKLKHGGVTETFDQEGRFDPGRFEAIFSKYAKNNPNKLNNKEIDDLLNANRDIHDFFGTNTTKIQWKLFFKLAKDSDGTVSKEAVRGIYDGSVFYYLEAKRKKRRCKCKFFRCCC